LLEQSPWWLVPYLLLMLVMLHAMLEFTVSLLGERPSKGRKPLSGDELRRRLLGLDQDDQPYPLVKGRDCDLEIAWEIEAPAQPSRFALTRSASRGRLRFLLDEGRRELRMHQVTGSYYYFLGFSGWIPRLAGYAGVQAGPPDSALTREIRQAALRSGWTVRPVLWWFQATYSGYRFLQRITPSPLRRMPARLFWGILYPVSFFLGIGYLLVVAGPVDSSGWLVLILVVAAWWGVWGFLVWTLLGFPAFWRR
jgi:hypothetical protein